MKIRKAYQMTTNSTYRLWILSYLAIAILPILFGWIIYVLSSKALEESLRANYEREAIHLSNRMDAILDEMQEITQTLLVQTELEYISRKNAEDMSKTQYVVRLNEVQKLLKFYSLNEHIEDIYVFSHAVNIW